MPARRGAHQRRGRSARRVGAGALGALAVLLLCGPAGPAGPAGSGDAGSRAAAPAAFVALREVAPGVEEDLRYASADNFVGEVIDGYREPVCLLTRDAALALRRADDRLAARGLGLRVMDCYRPRRAVAHFVRWAREPAGPGEARRRAAHHPRVPKEELFARGYVARRSAHSLGGTVDVTLVRQDGGRGRAVDMGTPFDFFDPRSHPASRAVGREQRAARLRLRSAMVAEGFTPVATEWWHFTHEPERFAGGAGFDFPVTRASLADGGRRSTQRRRRSHPRGSRAAAALTSDARRPGVVQSPAGLSPVRDMRAAAPRRSARRVSRRRGAGRRAARSPGAGRRA